MRGGQGFGEAFGWLIRKLLRHAMVCSLPTLHLGHPIKHGSRTCKLIVNLLASRRASLLARHQRIVQSVLPQSGLRRLVSLHEVVIHHGIYSNKIS